MTKRTNPFVEDFIPQSKTHIGIKQFNNNEVRLQKVYEKTLHLLFKGAKKVAAQDAACNTNLITIKKDNLKQLFIGNDGGLLRSGNMVQINALCEQCSCGGTSEVQCAYCEATLCCGCKHCCEKCQSSFCSHCSLIGLDGAEVCVSCYG